MLVLVLDTSSAAVTAAIADLGTSDTGGTGGTGGTGPVRIVAEHVEVNPRGHAELLAPAIRAGLADAGARPADLAAVIAGTGPGPYTGLRVGLVTAAVFGDVLGLPTYGVCSLDAIGAACPDDAELLVATDARRKEVYWARYRFGTRVGEPAVARPHDVPVDGLVAAAGASAGLFALPERPVAFPPAQRLAELAAARVRSGAPGEALTPLYLRRPDAVANPTVKSVTP